MLVIVKRAIQVINKFSESGYIREEQYIEPKKQHASKTRLFEGGLNSNHYYSKCSFDGKVF